MSKDLQSSFDVSSPNYTPKSSDNNITPDFSTIQRKYASSSDFNNSDELIQRPSGSDKQTKEKRKNNRNKNKAESQFDSSAKPVLVSSFFQSLIVDNDDFEIDSDLTDLKVIEYVDKTQNSLECEKRAISNLIIANNSYNEEEDFGLNQLYPEDIVEEFKQFDEIENGINQINAMKVDRKIFVKRRLFESLQYRSLADPKLTASHFPMKRGFQFVNANQLIDDDQHSVEWIKKKLKKFSDSHSFVRSALRITKKTKDGPLRSIISTIFDNGSDHANILLIVSFLVNYLGEIPKRSKLVKDIHPFFRNSRFKDLNVKKVFNSLGLGFFNDYGFFDLYQKGLANLLIYQHDQVMKKIVQSTDELKTKKRIYEELPADLQKYLRSREEIYNYRRSDFKRLAI